MRFMLAGSDEYFPTFEEVEVVPLLQGNTLQRPLGAYPCQAVDRAQDVYFRVEEAIPSRQIKTLGVLSGHLKQLDPAILYYGACVDILVNGDQLEWRELVRDILTIPNSSADSLLAVYSEQAKRHGSQTGSFGIACILCVLDYVGIW